MRVLVEKKKLDTLSFGGIFSRPNGCGFEPHWRHCIVFLSKNINPGLVLVQPSETRPFITERLLMGRKESNQTNKQNLEVWIFVIWFCRLVKTFALLKVFMVALARICLLVDLWDFFRFRVEGGAKKSSENDQLTGHFQNFFFLISSEKTVKLVR